MPVWSSRQVSGLVTRRGACFANDLFNLARCLIRIPRLTMHRREMMGASASANERAAGKSKCVFFGYTLASSYRAILRGNKHGKREAHFLLFRSAFLNQVKKCTSVKLEYGLKRLYFKNYNCDLT